MIHLISESGASGEDSTLCAWIVHFLLDIGLLNEKETSAPATVPPVAAELFGSIDDFQIKILKFLLIILVINVTAIYLAWKHYGPRITDRFMKPVSLKVIEELKTGATELKLPAEHSPRI